MSSGKGQPFCLSLNVLTNWDQFSLNMSHQGKIPHYEDKMFL